MSFDAFCLIAPPFPDTASPIGALEAPTEVGNLNLLNFTLYSLKCQLKNFKGLKGQGQLVQSEIG